MAVSDATGVANNAIFLCGEKGEISDIAGTDALAKVCNQFYDDTRDEVQRILPWACLKTATAISASAATNSGFSYYHTLAATVATVLNINGDEEAEFARYGTSLYLRTDTGYFEHTAFSSTVSAWDPLLLEAISQCVASKICVRITGSPQTALLLYQKYLATLLSAVKLEHIEGDAGEFEEMIAAMSNYVPIELLQARAKIRE